MKPLVRVMSVLVAIAIATVTVVSSQTGDARAVRIARVEVGLLPAVVAKGQNTSMTLQARMTRYNVPGVSVAVINGGAIDWAKGYGVAEAGASTPVTTDTLFQAASISKPVAAMGMLALVEQGRLSLDENVNAKLKSWKIPENDFTKEQKVTLRRLVSHSAGTTVHGFRGYEEGESSALALGDRVRPRHSAMADRTSDSSACCLRT